MSKRVAKLRDLPEPSVEQILRAEGVYELGPERLRGDDVLDLAEIEELEPTRKRGTVDPAITGLPAACGIDAFRHLLGDVLRYERRVTGEAVVDEVSQAQFDALHSEIEPVATWINRFGRGAELATLLVKSVGEMFDPPRQELIEAVAFERALFAGGQPMAREYAINVIAHRRADLSQVLRRRLLPDPDVRCPVDQGVVQDGVDLGSASGVL